MRHIELKHNSTFETACSYYMRSKSFCALTTSSQKKYMSNLKVACRTKVQGNKILGRLPVKDIRYAHLNTAYDTWLDKGTRAANYISTNVSIVLNDCIRHSIIPQNLMALVPKLKCKPRRTVWTFDQVKLFLNTAYSDFKWRSIGLICHILYESGQRVGDIRLLKWDSVDLVAQRMDIRQNKRGVDVHLSIGDTLTKVLQKQKEEYDGLSEYVAPRTVARAGNYSCYEEDEISKLFKQVKQEVNLSNELQARDLRRTAVVEMSEVGVDWIGIKQVTGHQSHQSLVPYLVNTFSGAKDAQERRRDGRKQS